MIGAPVFAKNSTNGQNEVQNPRGEPLICCPRVDTYVWNMGVFYCYNKVNASIGKGFKSYINEDGLE